MVYRSPAELDFTVDELPRLPAPGRVLLTRPTYYEVVYAINPYMADQIGKVDPARASEQWSRLMTVYEDLGYELEIVDGAIGLPDMVFCANQTLPVIRPDGSKEVVLSRMRMEQRRDEVPYYRDVFERSGYNVREIPAEIPGTLEGMGDGLWHRGRYLLWGGYGLRTDPNIYEWLSETLDLTIIALELEDPRFYHLDTCLTLLDPETALVCPQALTDDGNRLIKQLFDTVIEAPLEEASTLLACNAHCPDGTHVLIHEGCTTTIDQLHSAGFTSIELDTSEFLKAGGSVSCMKLMYW